MKLHHELLEEFTYGEVGEEQDGWTLVQLTHGSSRRWSRTNTVVITDGREFYSFYYEEGLTENQHVDKFYPDSEGMIELTLVKPVEKVITTYVPAVSNVESPLKTAE